MKWIMALVVFLGVSGCNPTANIPEYYKPVLSVAEIYNQGYQQLVASQYRSAVKTLRQMEQHYPYSRWSARSRMLLAYAHFKLRQCYLTEALVEAALELYPLEVDVPYAKYLRARCYFEEISDVQIDQQIAQKAYTFMDELVRNHPNTPYANDAINKARYAFNHLAAKEMSIGRQYQQQNACVAAIIRYQRVLTDFPQTEQIPEALYRQVECYLNLGLVAEAQQYAALLYSNYPQSSWYAFAYSLLDELQVLPLNANDAVDIVSLR